jgi:hypothetical protein
MQARKASTPEHPIGMGVKVVANKLDEAGYYE